jgi:hypothetical protein
MPFPRLQSPQIPRSPKPKCETGPGGATARGSGRAPAEQTGSKGRTACVRACVRLSLRRRQLRPRVARHFRRVPGWPDDVAESEEEAGKLGGGGGLERAVTAAAAKEEAAAGPGPRASVRPPWMRIGRGGGGGGGGGGVGGPAPGLWERGG